jgi:hypothetical protein
MIRNLFEWITCEHIILTRCVAAKAHGYAVASRYRFVAFGGACDFVPEPSVALVAVFLRFYHHGPSLESAVGVVHFFYHS